MFGGVLHLISGIVHGAGALGMASTGMAAGFGQALFGRRVRHALEALQHVGTERSPGSLAEPHARVAIID